MGTAVQSPTETSDILLVYLCCSIVIDLSR
jgi:hypothetical protein